MSLKQQSPSSDAAPSGSASWISALWAALAILAAASMLFGSDRPPPQAAAADVANAADTADTSVAAMGVPAQIDGITPSEPGAQAARDQLASTP